MSGLPDPPPPPAGERIAPSAPAVAPAAPQHGPPALAATQPAPRLALFRIGGRLCGVAAAFCKQFVLLDAVTPVPLGPAHLLGVTQLRGRILPVLDPSLLPGISDPMPPDAADDGPRSAGAAAMPPATGGMPVLVVTATGLDSALAALKVTAIVGFERPSFGAAAREAANTRPLWRGEEVLVLDVADLLASLRPRAQGAAGSPGVLGTPMAAPESRGAAAASR
jgi:chemotaxis signal transduction protein